MPPRRPTAPHAGAAARSGARPGAPSGPRPGAGAPGSRPSGADRRPIAPSRGSSRPSAAGTPAAGLPAAAGRTGRTVRMSTGRPPLVRPVTMLSGVLVIVTLLLAPYIRPWVTQRSQIDAGREQVEDLQREVTALDAELRRWNDPAFVRAQARQRLNFVMPGESGFVLLVDGAHSVTRPDPRSATAAVPTGGDGQVWYAKVWDSIRIAGDPTTEQARTTGTR